MNLSFNPVSLPKAQPKFGASLHPLTQVIGKVSELVPSISQPALQQLTDLLMARPGYKPTMAATFANGDLAVVTNKQRAEWDFCGTTIGDAPQPPQYYVYYGQPGSLIEHGSTSALHVSSCADLSFADPAFKVSTDSGIATGNISVVVNGQASTKAARL